MAKDHTLEFLLAFDGRIHRLDKGYWLKFEIRRITPSEARPHGLDYSFTLHDGGGRRLIGFDNAHKARVRGLRVKPRAVERDHWHRTESDEARPYEFVDAERLLADFFAEVRRVLAERGVSDAVVEESKIKRRPK